MHFLLKSAFIEVFEKNSKVEVQEDLLAYDYQTEHEKTRLDRTNCSIDREVYVLGVVIGKDNEYGREGD